MRSLERSVLFWIFKNKLEKSDVLKSQARLMKFSLQLLTQFVRAMRAHHINYPAEDLQVWRWLARRANISWKGQQLRQLSFPGMQFKSTKWLQERQITVKVCDKDMVCKNSRVSTGKANYWSLWPVTRMWQYISSCEMILFQVLYQLLPANSLEAQVVLELIPLSACDFDR